MPRYEGGVGTYKVTTQDVLDALSNRVLDKREIVREIARAHGYPNRDGWSPYSVNKALDALTESGEVDYIQGDHWAAPGNDPYAKYYLARSTRGVVAARADQIENDRIKHDAEQWANQVIFNRYRNEWYEERDVRIAAVTPPDHASLWGN